MTLYLDSNLSNKYLKGKASAWTNMRYSPWIDLEEKKAQGWLRTYILCQSLPNKWCALHPH